MNLDYALLEALDREDNGLVDIPFHVGLCEAALCGPALLHFLKQRDLQLVSQKL